MASLTAHTLFRIWVSSVPPRLLLVVGFGCLFLFIVSACSGGEDKGKIAFVSFRDGDAEIFVMNLDGSEQTALTDNSDSDTQPLWSPDKKSITFVSQGLGDVEGNIDINVVDAKGEEIARLTNAPGSDSMHLWSPNGGRIAFISHRDDQPEIYLMDANGSNFTRVTFDEDEPEIYDWSPDGEWLAFSLKGPDVEDGIFVRNPDGVNLRQLTATKDYDARWSPNGSQLVVTSERDDNAEIYVMDSNGSDQTRLTHNTSDDSQPAWSPDGKMIAYVSARDGNAEIYVMMADGSNQRRLTFNEAADEKPVWSRDGKHIAFVSFVYGTGEIFVMDADGNNQKRLTNNAADDIQPSW